MGIFFGGSLSGGNIPGEIIQVAIFRVGVLLVPSDFSKLIISK